MNVFVPYGINHHKAFLSNSFYITKTWKNCQCRCVSGQNFKRVLDHCYRYIYLFNEWVILLIVQGWFARTMHFFEVTWKGILWLKERLLTFNFIVFPLFHAVSDWHLFSSGGRTFKIIGLKKQWLHDVTQVKTTNRYKLTKCWHFIKILELLKEFAWILDEFSLFRFS